MGRPRRGDDHGVNQYLQLGLHPKPQRVPALHEHCDGRDGGRGRCYA